MLKCFMLSHVQNQILTLLLRADRLKYSQAKPAEITQDLFNYHLKFLIDKKYVQKDESFYKLTDFGKKYVQQLDVLGDFKNYFKVSVLPYVVREVEGVKEILVQKRGRHPYKGDTGTVSGKVNYGEKIEDAARRKLKEETGLDCNNFVFFGVHRKTRLDNKQKLIEDTLYHCCYAENPEGTLVSKNEFGDNNWISFPEVYKLLAKNVTASAKTIEVYKKVELKDLSLFYFHEEITLASF